MEPGADVRAIDALREWAAALANFRHETEESLAGIQMEIRRGTDWVHQQLDLWQRAIREREEEVVQAKAELVARQFPDFSGKMPDTTLQERNLRRAKARYEHAQEQVQICRKWIVNLPKMIDETYSGAAHRLQTLLDGDVAKGQGRLKGQIEALERYAEDRPDFAPTPSAVLLPTASTPVTLGGRGAGGEGDSQS